MELSTQQQLLLDQTLRLCDSVDRTGEHLDGKAGTILQAGSLIIALTGATTLPSLVAGSQSPYVLAALSVGFLAFIGMTACAVWAWRPSDHKLVGAETWEDSFTMYINQEPEKAYQQVLFDLLESVGPNMATNARKARYVTLATWLLVLQVVGILVIALASAL